MPTITAPLAKVRLSPTLAREIDPDHVRSLAEKIKNGFMLPPPLAEKSEDGFFDVVVGAHRTEAHRAAGKDSIDLTVSDKPFTPKQKFLEQWNEQQGRTGFTVFEKADLILRLMAELGCTQEEVAEHLRISPATVAKILAISTHLAPALRESVVSGDLPAKHAYHIAALRDDHQGQREVAAMKLPKASAVEREVKKRLGRRPKAAKPLKIAVADKIQLQVADGTTKEQLRAKLLEFLRRLRKNPPPDGQGPISFPW